MVSTSALHGLFILGSTASYGLPAWEGIERGSPFYTLLFLVLGCLSFVLHCDETGVCTPLAPDVHARIAGASTALSLFLLGVVLLVVFEVRGELLGRLVSAAWALVAWVQFSTAAPSTNAAVMFALSFGVLLFDIARFKRKFTGAYFKRLGLIALMAACGAGLFSLMSAWLWHGVWHLYAAGSTYLLLLAQRHKRILAARPRADGSASSGNASGMGGGLTTPMKRRGGGSATVSGATAAQTDGGASSTSAIPV